MLLDFGDILPYSLSGWVLSGAGSTVRHRGLTKQPIDACVSEPLGLGSRPLNPRKKAPMPLSYRRSFRIEGNEYA